MQRVIDGLSRDAERHGKALLGPLEGLRSVRAARSRYRIIFAVDRPRRVVSVLLVGERRAGEREDIYALAQKLLKTFLRGGI